MMASQMGRMLARRMVDPMAHSTKRMVYLMVAETVLVKYSANSKVKETVEQRW